MMTTAAKMFRDGVCRDIDLSDPKLLALGAADDADGDRLHQRGEKNYM